MSASRKLIDALNQYSKNNFWGNPPDNPTFKEVLDQYAAYYQKLDKDERVKISTVFWEQIKSIGTPIIEDVSQDKCRIYFLFRKDKILESVENPGIKKDIYLQGDIHGYDATTSKQRLNELKDTGIMLHMDDAIPKDAIVNYRFIQLEPSLRNKQPRPDLPPFFGDTPSGASPNYGDTLPPTLEESQKFWSPEAQCVDENSVHRASLPGNSEKVFRVNSDSKLSCIDDSAVNWQALLAAGGKPKNFNHHATFLSDLDGNLKQANLPISDQYVAQFFYTNNDSPLSQFTRAIHLFKPTSGKIDNVVIVNDGVQYLVIGMMEQLEKMANEGKLQNTAFVFVTTMAALEKTVKVDDPKALMQGMGFGRTIDYEHGIEEYASFINTTLFPQLQKEGMLPSDANHRLVMGASMGGTASLYLTLNHPELFGGAIAQSPSPANRRILNDIVAESDLVSATENLQSI